MTDQPYSNDQSEPYGALPVRLVTADGLDFYNAGGGVPTGGVTPRALLAKMVATGGDAVALVVGPCNGGYLTNQTTAARQGIGAAEPFYVDAVAEPGSTDAAAAAQPTTAIIDPGGYYTIPPLAAGVTLWGNAATGGHIIYGEVW